MPKQIATSAPASAQAPVALSIPMRSAIRDIRYLSFQGGGMKGIGDVGALEVLDESGVLPQIEAVAGSSVGGIMAMLVAIGCTPEEIKTEMLNLDFQALQDKAEPGWIESMSPSAIKPLKIFRGLEQVEDIAGWALGSSLGLFEGHRLCTVLEQILAKKGLSPNLSFSELAALAKDPQLPQKNLILTGSNLTSKKLEYYSAENTPHMSIIKAVRISASFPGAFKPVQSTENGVLTTRVDGGLLENLPDVFNQTPYYKSEKNGVGNPKVLALSFKKSDKKEKKIKSGLALVKSLYETLLSTDHLKAKYDRHLIDIDTVGMETLEFDASEEKKQKLVQSGRRAAYDTLNNILQAEQKSEAQENIYAKMPLEALIKTEAALEVDFSHCPRQEKERLEQQLIAVKRSISRRLKTSDTPVDESVLPQMRQDEKAYYQGIWDRAQKKPLSEKALSTLFKQKKEHLELLQSRIENRFDVLQVSKKSLLDYQNNLIINIETNTLFRADLDALRSLEYQRSSLYLGHRNRESEIELSKNAQAMKALLTQKITHYEKLNPLLMSFFKDLLEKSPEYTVPVDKKSIREMLRPEIKACNKLIAACEKDMQENVQEKHLIEQKILGLSKNNQLGDRYEALLNFNMALDEHIYKKTNFLSKINEFFIREAPRLSVITRPFFQFVSMAAFIGSLPIGIPAVSIAKAIELSSNNAEVKMTAKKIGAFFKYRNPNNNLFLKDIQRQTKEFITIIKKNYEQSDQSGNTYLFKLYALYLKNSGIRFEDIIQRKPNEKIEAYKKRIAKTKEQFEVISHQDRAIANIGFKQKHTAPPLSKLRSQVLQETMGLTSQEWQAFKKLTPKERQKWQKSRVAQKATLGIEAHDLSFFYGIRKKITQGQVLTATEQADFMALGPKFKQQYPNLYRDFEDIYAGHLAQFRGLQAGIQRRHGRRPPSKELLYLKQAQARRANHSKPPPHDNLTPPRNPVKPRRA